MRCCTSSLSLIGEDHVLFSSDFPHGEGRENAALEILERKDLSEAQKETLLYDNTVRFSASPRSCFTTSRSSLLS